MTAGRRIWKATGNVSRQYVSGRKKEENEMKKLLSAFVVFILVLTVFGATALADYYTGYQTLSYGTTSSEVKNLQNDLKNLGYFSGTSTGYFGSATKASVVAYQKGRGLTADGIVGHGTARSIKVDRIVQTGKWYLGVPYVFGGSTTAGFDCSGFTQYVMAQNRVSIPRTAELQYGKGTSVSKTSLKKGDLVFFETYKAGPSHVGIYLGNDQFIHASSGAGKVIISSLFSNTYYSAHYIGARRVLP
jgi:peptidoglycan endopeptidase LytE